jgi:hypothetical protein
MLLRMRTIVEPRRTGKHLRYTTVYVGGSDELQVQRDGMHPRCHPKWGLFADRECSWLETYITIRCMLLLDVCSKISQKVRSKEIELTDITGKECDNMIKVEGYHKRVNTMIKK